MSFAAVVHPSLGMQTLHPEQGAAAVVVLDVETFEAPTEGLPLRACGVTGYRWILTSCLLYACMFAVNKHAIYHRATFTCRCLPVYFISVRCSSLNRTRRPGEGSSMSSGERLSSKSIIIISHICPGGTAASPSPLCLWWPGARAYICFIRRRIVGTYRKKL